MRTRSSVQRQILNTTRMDQRLGKGLSLLVDINSNAFIEILNPRTQKVYFHLTTSKHTEVWVSGSLLSFHADYMTKNKRIYACPWHPCDKHLIHVGWMPEKNMTNAHRDPVAKTIILRMSLTPLHLFWAICMKKNLLVQKHVLRTPRNCIQIQQGSTASANGPYKLMPVTHKLIT